MKRALAVLALGLVAACGSDATGPLNALSGSYRLRLYNGANLPTYVDDAFGACSPMIAAASMTIGADGGVTLVQSNSAPCTPGAPITAATWRGSVAVDGTTVTMTMDSDVAGGNRMYIGTLAGGVLTLNHLIDYGPRQLAQFYTFERQ
jgi:hypothetical protein